MKALKKFDISWKVAKALIFKKKIPLVIGWNITYRCNLRCQYCGYPERNVIELDTDSIFCLIDEIVSLGSRIIIISGGEPLMHKDLGRIIQYMKKKKVYVVLYSNGWFVERNVDNIKEADEIQLSLDGSETINDFIRGEGVYAKVLQAIKICKAENIKLNLSTVICKYNVSQITDVLDVAKRFNVRVTFQPVGRRFSGDSDNYEDFPSRFAPEKNDYKRAIAYLLNEKRKGNALINNSISGLEHFLRCESNRQINCIASLISCIIEPDGKIFVCEMFPDYQKYLVPGYGNFRESFEKLRLPALCQGNCNGPMIELNLINNGNFNAIVGMWKRFRKSY